MALSDRIDVHSLTWKVVSRHSDKSIESAREKLEKRGTEHGQSEYLRGKIAAYKEIFELALRDTGSTG